MSTTIQPQVPEKKEFDLLPEDTYRVEITSIEDEERPQYSNPEETEKVTKLEFTLLEEPFEGRKLWAWARPSLFPGSTALSPSTLYGIISAVYRKNLTEQELATVTAGTINQMLGCTLRLLVKQTKNTKGEDRNKIESYLQDKEGTAPSLGSENEIPVINVDEEINTEDVPF